MKVKKTINSCVIYENCGSQKDHRSCASHEIAKNKKL